MTYLLGKFFQTIPMDGTFHQTRPLCRLSGAKVTYSVDLKSATDRLVNDSTYHYLCNFFLYFR